MKKNIIRKWFCSTLVLTMLAGSALAASPGEAAAALSYSDVPEAHYAARAIGELKRLGIVEAAADGAFRPDAEITRGETAVWLSNTLKLGKPASLHGFTDVPADSPYAEAVNALKERDIVQGAWKRCRRIGSLTVRSCTGRWGTRRRIRPIWMKFRLCCMPTGSAFRANGGATLHIWSKTTKATAAGNR